MQSHTQETLPQSINTWSDAISLRVPQFGQLRIQIGIYASFCSMG
jgi:hypothetical protein